MAAHAAKSPADCLPTFALKGAVVLSHLFVAEVANVIPSIDMTEAQQ